MQVQNKINDLLSQIESLIKQESLQQYSNSQSKENEYRTKVNAFITRINHLLENEQLDKRQKTSLIFSKGKVLQIINEQSYLKEAEENVSKYLKLQPKEIEGWNLFAEIKMKKNDHKGAQQCLMACLQQCGKDKKTLRNLSIVLRMFDDEERLKNVQFSVDYAKQAVEMDMQDGESWYILGNAYCSNFFVSQQKLDQLQLSLKAYNYAQKLQFDKCPDLYYNRAQIYQYLEMYLNSLQDFKKTQQLDPNLNSQLIIQQIENKLVQMQQSIDSKGKLSQKTIGQMIRDIPQVLKKQPNYEIKSISSLKEGINQGVILSGKVIKFISNKQDVPASFIFMDFNEQFGVLSLYNSSQDLYDRINQYSNIQIKDPIFKNVKISLENKNIDLNAIQVFETKNLFVEGSNAIKEFNANVLVNENYLK